MNNQYKFLYPATTSKITHHFTNDVIWQQQASPSNKFGFVTYVSPNIVNRFQFLSHWPGSILHRLASHHSAKIMYIRIVHHRCSKSGGSCCLRGGSRYSKKKLIKNLWSDRKINFWRPINQSWSRIDFWSESQGGTQTKKKCVHEWLHHFRGNRTILNFPVYKCFISLAWEWVAHKWYTNDWQRFCGNRSILNFPLYRCPGLLVWEGVALVFPIIWIFMIDLNKKSTIKEKSNWSKNRPKKDQCIHCAMIDLLLTNFIRFHGNKGPIGPHPYG